MHDIIIIGAGIVGCATARELSRYRLDTLVLEAFDDVACGTTKANSAIVHSGHSTRPGSLMARYNLRGNQLYAALCAELDIPFRANGHLTLALSPEELPRLEQVLSDGRANGVPGLRLLSREETLRLEPRLNPALCAALLAPSGAIVCPYECAQALAESAAINGVRFEFNARVTQVRRAADGTFVVSTADGRTRQARAILNAAGVHADTINNQLSAHKLRIRPRAGDYWMLDKRLAGSFTHTIFQVPGPLGKGVLVSPTVDGTLIVGPTARDIEDGDDTATTAAGLQAAFETARRSWPELPRGAFITTFAGVRAHLESHDFVLGEMPDVPLAFNAAGIESPGLTSAPAIAVDLAQEMAERLGAVPNASWRPGRPPVRRFREMSDEERREAIASDPDFSRVVCRCELVTEAEIRAAIRRPLGARSVDAVKRRTRAGMGRCQSGFCLPRTMEILAEELHCPLEDITKMGGASRILTGELPSGHQE